MKKLFTLIPLLTLLVIPSQVLAQPKVTIDIIAEKEVNVMEQGQQVTKLVPAEETFPGEKIRYTLRYVNSGNEPAYKVAINDPVPEGTVYISGTAQGDGSKISFSIDGGKSYKNPSLLFYETTAANGARERKIASPEEYTDVRWVIEEIKPGSAGQCSFWVQVK